MLSGAKCFATPLYFPPTAAKLLPSVPTSAAGAPQHVAERERLLSDFVAWARQHITGDEKGEAQIFLDRIFRAFGQKGSLAVGGVAEMHPQEVRC